MYEKDTILYLRVLLHTSQPEIKAFYHVSIIEKSVYFSCLGLDTSGLLHTVNFYTSPAYVTGYR